MQFLASRMAHLQSAIFSELAQQKARLVEAGRGVLDLGIGSPDLPPPPHVVQALKDALTEEGVFGYPESAGTQRFRVEIAEYLARRYGVHVDAEREVLSLLGAQDALSHLPLAFVNPGDIALIPDPGYPIYEVAVHLAGGTPFRMPCRESNGFLPDLAAIPTEIADQAKLMVLNYPGNPLASLAPAAFFADVIQFARQHDVIIVHDAAYIELVFDGKSAPSFLQQPGASEVGIELHSFSKTFNMAGPRLAFAVGCPEILAGLRLIKSNIDYGAFSAVQAAGIAALADDHGHITAARLRYQERRDAFLSPLHRAGWNIRTSDATMFIWAKIPTAETSRAFSARLLEQTGIVCVPGVAFGPEGEGYVRFAMVRSQSELADAAGRIARAL